MSISVNERSDPANDRIRWSFPGELAALDTILDEWAIQAIEGVGGLNDFEHYEMAVANCSDRLAAAIWVLKALGNNLSDQTEAVVQAIIERRAALRAGKAGKAL